MKKMIIKLREFSTIRTGITQRGSSDKNSVSSFFLIQPKDIKDGIISGNLNSVDIDKKLALNHLLKKDDLLIVNKGLNYGTLLFDKKDQDYLASNSFFIIKIDKTKCLPRYLQWFLQQQETKEYLSRNSPSTTVPSLNKPALENMEVSLPSIETQEKIVEFLKVSIAQKEILHKMMESNEAYRDSYIWSLININPL